MENYLHQSRFINAAYLRNFVFGVEDSLVSTVGLLVGIASAGVPRSTILITGFILIIVEAFSMAVGSFLSEHSAEDYVRQEESSFRQPVIGGVIMFSSYFLSGFIPLGPFMLFSPENARWISVGCTILSLFILGAIGARLSRTDIMKSAFRMGIIGGVAASIGVIASKTIGVNGV